MIPLVVALCLPCIPRASAQTSRIGGEVEAAYVSRYIFRGTDRLNDDGAFQGHIELTTYDVLDPGDLVTGIWGSMNLEGAWDENDELRYYVRLENTSEDRKVQFSGGSTYYDFKGDNDFFDDVDNRDVIEVWVGIQLLRAMFQPTIQVYYDRPVSSNGPEEGIYASLNTNYSLPLAKFLTFGPRLGFDRVDFDVTGWYQDGVYRYEPGGSVQGSIALPFTLWNMEIRPAVHMNHLFQDPAHGTFSDDDDEVWFTVAATYWFGRSKRTEEQHSPFEVRAEDLFHGLEMPK